MRYRDGLTLDELLEMGVYDNREDDELLGATEFSDLWCDELLDRDDEALYGWPYDEPDDEGDEEPPF